MYAGAKGESMRYRSKRYRALASAVKAPEAVALPEAVKRLKQFATTKFNSAVKIPCRCAR